MIKKLLASGAAAGALVAGTVALDAPSAHARGIDYGGKVTAGTSLTVRRAPSTHAKAVDSYRHGKVIGLGCWVPGASVGGNRTWYAMPSDGPGYGYVSAKYLKLTGKKPPACTGNRAHGKATTKVSLRTAPNTKDTRDGTLAKGDRITIICKAVGQRIDGDDRWYLTTKDHWVSARYLKVTSGTPQWCRWPN